MDMCRNLCCAVVLRFLLTHWKRQLAVIVIPGFRHAKVFFQISIDSWCVILFCQTILSCVFFVNYYFEWFFSPFCCVTVYWGQINIFYKVRLLLYKSSHHSCTMFLKLKEMDRVHTICARYGHFHMWLLEELIISQIPVTHSLLTTPCRNKSYPEPLKDIQRQAMVEREKLVNRVKKLCRVAVRGDQLGTEGWPGSVGLVSSPQSHPSPGQRHLKTDLDL